MCDGVDLHRRAEFLISVQTMTEFKFPSWELGGLVFCLQRTFQPGEEGKSLGSPLSLGEAVGFRRPDGPPEATLTSSARSYGLLLRFFSLLLLWKQPVEGLLTF